MPEDEFFASSTMTAIKLTERKRRNKIWNAEHKDLVHRIYVTKNGTKFHYFDDCAGTATSTAREHYEVCKICAARRSKNTEAT